MKQYRIVLSSAFLLMSCNSAKISHKEYKSPDGKNVITFTASDRGACCSTSFEAILNKNSDGKKIFTGSGSGKYSIFWNDSNHAMIYVENINDYSLSARFLKDPPIQQDGSENALRFRFTSN